MLNVSARCVLTLVACASCWVLLFLLLHTGSTFTCPAALTISVASSNVRISIGAISLTGGATLGSCSPVSITLPLSQSLVMDPTVHATTTCTVVSPVLTQDDFEAGNVAWGVTAGSVTANGGNSTIDGQYQVNFDKQLILERKYRLGIKRVAVDANDQLAAVSNAGEGASSSRRA